MKQLIRQITSKCYYQISSNKYHAALKTKLLKLCVYFCFDFLLDSRKVRD
jgi:hypothetical protein